MPRTTKPTTKPLPSGRLWLALAGVAALLALAAAPSLAPAAPEPPDYYDTVGALTGEDLKLELREIISGNRGYPVTTISYSAARDALLQSVDNIGGGNIRTVYLSEERPTSDWATVINREHTWPQSYGAGVSPKKSDMHHLFLCMAVVNGARGNNLYGDVDTMDPMVDVFMSADMEPGDTNYRLDGVWQVSDNRKGDVARAILYMDTRFADLTLINRGETLGADQMGYLNDLLAWHAADPPDAAEVLRNDRVFDFQNNRNPYVDNPSFVTLVYGGPGGPSDPIMTNLVRSPVEPDETQTVTVMVDATDPDGVASVDLFWRTGASGPFTQIAMPGAGPTYTAAMPIPAQPEGTTVQYYAEAADTLANTGTIPPAGAAGPVSYVVIGDSPVLTNLQTNPPAPDDTSAVDIFVNATDDDGNTGANLTLTANWRLQSLGGAFNAIPMTLSSGTQWQTTMTIPAQAEGEVVEYYVEAMDLGGAFSFIPPAGAAGPAEYDVEATQPFQTITSVAQVNGELLITEIIFRRAGDSFEEYVEIVNNSTQGYIIDNLSISDNGAGGDTGESFCLFPPNSTLPPGGIAVVFVRNNPDQTYVNSIPVLSSDGRAVQVFVLEDSMSSPLSFNGTPVPEMLPGDGTTIQLGNSGDNVALVLGTSEVYNLADVIDGAAYGSPSGGDLSVWSATVSNTDTVSIAGGADGIARVSEIDTDTVDDWEPVFEVGSPTYSPGEVPFTVVPVELSAFALE